MTALIQQVWYHSHRQAACLSRQLLPCTGWRAHLVVEPSYHLLVALQLLLAVFQLAPEVLHLTPQRLCRRIIGEAFSWQVWHQVPGSKVQNAVWPLRKSSLLSLTDLNPCGSRRDSRTLTDSSVLFIDLDRAACRQRATAQLQWEQDSTSQETLTSIGCRPVQLPLCHACLLPAVVQHLVALLELLLLTADDGRLAAHLLLGHAQVVLCSEHTTGVLSTPCRDVATSTLAALVSHHSRNRAGAECLQEAAPPFINPLTVSAPTL